MEPLVSSALMHSENLMHIADTDKSSTLLVLTDERVMVINGKGRDSGVQVEIPYSEVAGCTRFTHPDGPILRVERRGRVFPGVFWGEGLDVGNQEMLDDVNVNTVQVSLFSTSTGQCKDMEQWIDLKTGTG